MMRRNLLITLGICILGIILNILTGCATRPPADDVWAMLERGETEGVMPYFLGSVGVNERDAQGRTPLHHAAELEDPQLANFFISLGADVDALDNELRTPLAISAEKLDADTARVIANGGANIHHSMGYNNSPARIALRGNDEFLSAIVNSRSISSTDIMGRSILHLAADEGNARAVDILLRYGNVSIPSLITQTDINGKTALDLALERTDSRNHAEAAESLILAGSVSTHPMYTYFAPAVRTSNYNIRSADGMAPLHFMARAMYSGYVEFAIERRADVNIKNASGATPLHEAARSGNIEIMQLLLNNGAVINEQDANGNSVLHIAIPAESHLAAVNLFLAWGLDPNIQDEHGDTPLHTVIILNRSEEVVESLLRGGADVNIRNLQGKTPLYIAVENNRVSHIRHLLAYNSYIFAVDNNGISPFERALQDYPPLALSMVTNETVAQNDSAGNTMLHLAVRTGGSNDIINRILEHDLSIDARNQAGDTSLILAVRHNERASGELLLSRGANIFAVNARGESPLSLTFPRPGQSSSELRQWMLNPHTLSSHDGLGNTALHYAAQWQLSQWIPLLIQLGARTEAANATGETALFIAVRQDSPATISALVSNGASLSNRDSLGNSALHTAVRWNAINGARSLIEHGIDINAHALSGKTALHDAVRMWTDNIETMLVSSGANIEARDGDGNTPFMEAVMAGNVAAMRRLVNSGADFTSRNFRGDTPLHIAIAMERTDIVTQLLDLGSSIHARNSRERTPFQDALITSPSMVMLLLSRDRIHITDDNGSSPLHIAVLEFSSASMIYILLEMEARISSLDFEGKTPMRLALDLNQYETAKILADYGADVFVNARDGRSAAEVSLLMGENAVRALFSGRAISLRDSSGNTILHYAARNGDLSVISQLISLGAERNVRNIANESPGDIAQRWNHMDAAILLNGR